MSTLSQFLICTRIYANVVTNRFINEEHADIIFVYGLCNGNARDVAREYRIRFLHRHHCVQYIF